MTREEALKGVQDYIAVSYTHLRAHETDSYLVCRLLLEKKKKKKQTSFNFVVSRLTTNTNDEQYTSLY